jgi:hypothetical protein
MSRASTCGSVTQVGDIQVGDIQVGDIQVGDIQVGDIGENSFILISQDKYLIMNFIDSRLSR